MVLSAGFSAFPLFWLGAKNMLFLFIVFIFPAEKLRIDKHEHIFLVSKWYLKCIIVLKVLGMFFGHGEKNYFQFSRIFNKITENSSGTNLQRCVETLSRTILFFVFYSLNYFSKTISLKLCECKQMSINVSQDCWYYITPPKNNRTAFEEKKGHRKKMENFFLRTKLKYWKVESVRTHEIRLLLNLI